MAQSHAKASFYEEQLKKALNGPNKKAYEAFTVRGKPIGSGSTLGIFKEARRQRNKNKTGQSFMPNIPSPKVTKKCKNCQEVFEWDHKHSRKEFDARQFCNNQCKRLYYAKPIWTLN